MRMEQETQQYAEQWFQQLPAPWQSWLQDNIERGCDPNELAVVLEKNGFRRQDTSMATAMPTAVQALSSAVQEHILQCLLRGDHHDQIITSCVKMGVSSVAVRQFIEVTLSSASYQYLQKTQHQLNKRNWLMACLDQLAQLGDGYQTVPRIDTPPYQEFLRQFYSQHRPVILKNGIRHWNALQKWHPDYFADRVGHEQIEVQMDRQQDQNFEVNSPKLKQKILMKDFVAKIKHTDCSNDYYMTANNASQNQNITKVLYQDIADFGHGYCDLSLQDQLCFLWFGPKGTFTPIHHDLTNNMLVQIYGRKKVTLIPALQTPHIYNDLWVFSQLKDPNQIDVEQYPLAKKLTPIECILEPGEALFIPIGWWHAVESLDVSISVSFTHFNTPNQFYLNFPKEQ